MTPTVIAVFVGQPRTLDPDDPWTTSYFKSRVYGPVRLDEEGLAGNQQSDLRLHGGPDKAVCIYPAAHIEAWRSELTASLMSDVIAGEWAVGAFAENFSLAHQTEQTACIGDTYRVGTALVQITQPRGPCWKIGRRWNQPDLPTRVRESGRTGWYLRVLQAGEVREGQPLDLVERPFHQWTIARVNQLTYIPEDALDAEARVALAACPVLAPAWRTRLLQK